MKTRLLVSCLLLALTVIASPARSQDEEDEIVTDRPDITESSLVVGPGRFQIETGLLREYRSRGRSDERGLLTPTLLRYGLSRNWEARLETDGFSRLRTFSPGAGVERTAGYSPLAPGAKYTFQRPAEGSRRPTLGAIFHVNVPSGSGAFRGRKLTGDAKLAADWDLAPKWALGVNAGFGWEEDDSGDVFAFGLVTGSVGREWTDRLNSFIELAFQGPETSRGGHALILDGGFTYLVAPLTQLDVAVGTGLSGRTPADTFWTMGISRKF